MLFFSLSIIKVASLIFWFFQFVCFLNCGKKCAMSCLSTLTVNWLRGNWEGKNVSNRRNLCMSNLLLFFAYKFFIKNSGTNYTLCRSQLLTQWKRNFSEVAGTCIFTGYFWNMNLKKIKIEAKSNCKNVGTKYKRCLLVTKIPTMNYKFISFLF